MTEDSESDLDWLIEEISVHDRVNSPHRKQKRLRLLGAREL